MPLAFGLGRRRWEGTPSQKTSAAGKPEPLAEGGFVSSSLSSRRGDPRVSCAIGEIKTAILVAFAALVALLAVNSAGAATPHRIVSLSPTATESLFAIGAGQQVIAVDDQSDYPKRAPRTSLSSYTPNVEAIAGYRPDLVVLSGDANDVVGGLRKLGIRVLLQPAAQTLSEAYAQISQLGAVTAH